MQKKLANINYDYDLPNSLKKKTEKCLNSLKYHLFNFKSYRPWLSL